MVDLHRRKSDKHDILHRMRNIKILGAFLALTVAHTATLSLAGANEAIQAKKSLHAPRSGDDFLNSEQSQPAAPPSLSGDVDPEQALKNARAAMAVFQWRAAIDAWTTVLKANPANSEAIKGLQEAQAQNNLQRLFESNCYRARVKLDRGDYAGAQQDAISAKQLLDRDQTILTPSQRENMTTRVGNLLDLINSSRSLGPTLQQSKQSADAQKSSAESKTALVWADVLEQSPNPKVVTDADFLARIAATGLPWRVKDKGTGIEMLLVPPGKFVMGMSPGDTQAMDYEKPAHEVTLTKPFYLGRTEVTQTQWEYVASKFNPSLFHSYSDRDSMLRKLRNEGLTKSEAEAKAAKESTNLPLIPVENVSWNDCQKFCAKTNFLRLPTEAEWEYACRAGVRKPTYGDLDDIAWFAKNSSGTTHIVGKKLPNALGFYDMLGNVLEWCSDIHGARYYESCEDGVVDPKGAAEGSYRMLRGGGWNGGSYTCRSSYRYFLPPHDDPDTRCGNIGFRVARTP